MSTLIRITMLSLVLFGGPLTLSAQDASDAEPAADGLTVESVQETAEELATDTQQKVSEIAEQVDQSEQAKEVSAGILQPIYQLAETMSFPSFHWIAFTLMATGVVSFAMQLVLGKLVVLSKMSISIKEILSDAVGLIISLIGLVLTTQAAAENSNFTESPFMVLSAAGVGVILGFVLYLWGQKQEVEAAVGRKVQHQQEKAS